MKTTLAAFALATALAQPASAVQFSKLTTIYIGAGAYDDGGAFPNGTATVIHCSNVSGGPVDIRVLMLGANGFIEGQLTRAGLGHGQLALIGSHDIQPYGIDEINTGFFIGTVNIEATNSAVFCTATLMEAAGPATTAAPLSLVRVNPHPGTVE
jgi:hypothetical protein